MTRHRHHGNRGLSWLVDRFIYHAIRRGLPIRMIRHAAKLRREPWWGIVSSDLAWLRHMFGSSAIVHRTRDGLHRLVGDELAAVAMRKARRANLAKQRKEQHQP